MSPFILSKPILFAKKLSLFDSVFFLIKIKDKDATINFELGKEYQYDIIGIYLSYDKAFDDWEYISRLNSNKKCGFRMYEYSPISRKGRVISGRNMFNIVQRKVA